MDPSTYLNPTVKLTNVSINAIKNPKNPSKNFANPFTKPPHAFFIYSPTSNFF